MVVPLSVGQMNGVGAGSNGSSLREWEQALVEGMTHAHLRFEARSEAFRQAEVQDLVVALRPLLNALPVSDGEFIRLSPDRAVEEGAFTAALPDAEIDEIADPHQGEPGPERPWFGVARDWGVWSRARAARSLTGLLGRVRQSLSVKRAGGVMPADSIKTPKPIDLEHDGVKADDTAIAAGKQHQDDDDRQAAAEPPVPKPPVSQPSVPEPPVPEPPVSEPPASEPPVSEPPASEPPLGSRSDGSAGNVTAAKATLGLDPAVPVAMFADELSATAGADILVDAVITVGHDERQINFLFVGDGPLRGELEERVRQAGLAERSRFLGDASAESFAHFFAAADFVIIPARVRRNEVLARRAAAAGKPVLVTHQASVDAVVHGSNGLVTYDNPGSLVWGLRELVHCVKFTSSAESRLRESIAA